MVRPLIAPMAEAAAGRRLGPLDDRRAGSFAPMRLRPTTSALFFGEDIFIAIGSIILIKGILEQSGVIVQPLDLSLWAIPTAILAFAIHGTRLLLSTADCARSPAARQ